MELIRGVNLEQFTRQLADKRRVLPKELAVFITSRSRAAWPTRTRKPTRTASRWHRSPRREFQKHHDRL